MEGVVGMIAFVAIIVVAILVIRFLLRSDDYIK
jgi:hypothetical protein